MLTMWKNEKGDWSLTRFETPMCFGCTVKQGEKNEQGDIISTPSRMKFTDHTRTEAQCESCERIFWKEVA